MGDKQRIIDLQKQVTLARRALERIAHSSLDPVGTALTAIDEMQALDKGVPLTGLLGWEKRPK